MFELLRGATVLTVCSQQWLVNRAQTILHNANAVIGKNATEGLLRHTAFAHFVAGETTEDIAPKLDTLRSMGVGGILDYAAESDLEAAPSDDSTVNQPSRVHRHVDERHCDFNKDIFLAAVDAVHATTPEGFAAVKVTALGDPALLERVSTALVQLRAFFHRLDTSGRGVLSRDALLHSWREAFDMSDDEIASYFQQIDTHTTGDVDVLDFTNALRLETIGPLVQRCRSQGPLYHTALDADEWCALYMHLAACVSACTRRARVGVPCAWAVLDIDCPRVVSMTYHALSVTCPATCHMPQRGS